jgi:hypothetical protein
MATRESADLPEKESKRVDLRVVHTDGCWLRFTAGESLVGIIDETRRTTQVLDLDDWFWIPPAGRR